MIKVSWSSDGGWVSFVDSYGGIDYGDLDTSGVNWALLSELYLLNDEYYYSQPWKYDEAATKEESSWLEEGEQLDRRGSFQTDFEEARARFDTETKQPLRELTADINDSSLSELINDFGLFEVDVASEGRGGEATLEAEFELDKEAWDVANKDGRLLERLKASGFEVSQSL